MGGFLSCLAYASTIALLHSEPAGTGWVVPTSPTRKRTQ